MTKAIFCLFALMMLSACAGNQAITQAESTKTLVTVTHIYTGTEEEFLEPGTAQSRALQKCQARGYSKAEAVGPQQQTCTRYTGYYSCFYHRVDQDFLCTQ
jgi:ABC-type Fe3+-hydroxamate transport system substrate-binding protein